MITESIRKFQAPVYSRVKRSAETYRTVKRHCLKNLERLKAEYHAVVEEDQYDVGQLRREIRNDMDYYLRRYHKYCIAERDNMKGHYREVGAEVDTDFEHLIPAARIRDMYLFDEITVDHALNAPTVRLSREKHVALKDAGWNDDTPDAWMIWERYVQVFDAKFETYDGQPVDPKTWTLARHYEYFAHLHND